MQTVLIEQEPFQLVEVAQLRWDAFLQVIGVQSQTRQVRQRSKLQGDRARVAIGVQVQSLKLG